MYSTKEVAKTTPWYANIHPEGPKVLLFSINVIKSS